MVNTFSDLPVGGQDAVQMIQAMFGDLFDNNDYGPFLGEFTKFGQDRISQLVPIAIGDVCSYIAIPSTADYSYENYPYTSSAWYYTLILALELEVVQHLERSYVEIPDTSRVGASDVVRRDYLTRWQGLASDIEKKLTQATRKLAQETYDDQFASGAYVRTLIDFPSSANMFIPWLSAERKNIWSWW